jgi:hypothetical protein
MNTAEQLVEQIRIATDYQTNKRALREKILTDLHLTYNGGLFLVDQTLLAFLATWPSDELFDELFIEDVYNNPIKVVRTELLEQARQCYQAAMNSWHQEHDELRKIRKV